MVNKHNDKLRALYKLGQKTIVNNNIFNDRDMVKPTIEALMNIRGFKLLGYKRSSTTPEEIFQSVMQDYIHKAGDPVDGRNKTKKYIPTIDLQKSHMEQIDVHFILPIAKIKCSPKEMERYIKSTLVKFMNMKVQGSFDEFFKDALPPIPCSPDELKRWVPNEDEDLIISTKVYIPTLVNNMAYIINNKRYYGGYYRMERRTTKRGHLIVEHATHDSYLRRDDGVFTIKIFGKDYNPFSILMANKTISPALMFGEFWIEEAATFNQEAKDDIARTYEAWTKGGSVKEPDIDVTVDEVKNAIYIFYEDDDTNYTFSLTKALIRGIREEIMDKLPKTAGLDELKTRLNIRPHMILSAITKSKQYSISDSINEVDLDESFKFTRMLDSDETAGRKNLDRRKFTFSELGICAPEGTTQSKNVGMTGMLVYNIDDKYFRNK